MNSTCICGIRGESALAITLATTPTVKPVRFASQELVEIAQSTPIGRSRLKTATPFLLSEFGVPTKLKAQSYTLKLDWENIPYTTILDYVFGLDQVVNFRGWCLGIDATTDPSKIDSKVEKLDWLEPLWAPLGIERVAVCLLQEGASSDLRAGLRSILRGDRLIKLNI